MSKIYNWSYFYKALCICYNQKATFRQLHFELRKESNPELYASHRSSFITGLQTTGNLIVALTSGWSGALKTFVDDTTTRLVLYLKVLLMTPRMLPCHMVALHRPPYQHPWCIVEKHTMRLWLVDWVTWLFVWHKHIPISSTRSACVKRLIKWEGVENVHLKEKKGFNNRNKFWKVRVMALMTKSEYNEIEKWYFYYRSVKLLMLHSSSDTIMI